MLVVSSRERRDNELVDTNVIIKNVKERKNMLKLSFKRI